MSRPESTPASSSMATGIAEGGRAVTRVSPAAGAAIALGVLGLGVRLIGITQPFVDRWSWRQSDVAMIARNFFREGYHLLHPQIDWAGPAPGFVGTEFQLVAFVAALFYPLFGEHDWIGRSVSVAAFAVSLPFFFGLVRTAYGDRAALAALGFYAGAPLGIASGRSFMPDMTSVGLTLISLGLFTSWLRRRPRPLRFGAAAVTLVLAILVKPFAAIVGAAFLAAALAVYGWPGRRDPALWTLGVLALAVPAAWYAHAYRLSVSHPPHHFFGSGAIGLVSLDAYAKIAGELVFDSLTPVLAGLALGGLLVRRDGADGPVFHAWGAGVLLFAIVAGAGHLRHEWYQLGFVPVAAAFAGAGLDRLAMRLARARGGRAAGVVVVALALAFAGWGYARVRWMYEPRASAAHAAGLELRRLGPAGALVAVTDWGDPTTIYYSGGKGWHFTRNFGAPPESNAHAIGELETLRREGARYLVVLPHSMSWLERYESFAAHLDAHYPRVRQSDQYLVFDLAPPSRD